MLLCTKTLGCNKPDGHRSPCEKRVVKVTPELVTISYQKDGGTYLLSMPSEHAEWAEEMLSLDRAAVERAAAAKALTDAAEFLRENTDGAGMLEYYKSDGSFAYAVPADWLRARAAALGLTAGQEGEERCGSQLKVAHSLQSRRCGRPQR